MAIQEPRIKDLVISSNDIKYFVDKVLHFRLDYVLGFHILCECAKSKEEYALFFLQLGTSSNYVPSKQRQNLLRRNDQVEQTWSWELLAVYLRCLADISTRGLSVDIKKLSLFGDSQVHGLIDYLGCTAKGIYLLLSNYFCG